MEDAVDNVELQSRDKSTIFKRLVTSSVNRSSTNADSSNQEGKEYASTDPELFFRDVKRRIDFVLAYRRSADTPEKQRKRHAFLAQLLVQNLELEFDDFKSKEEGEDGEAKGEHSSTDVVFIKLHAPWDTLCSYGEVLKLRKPIRKELLLHHLQEDECVQVKKNIWGRMMNMCLSLNLFRPDVTKVKPIPRRFTYPFSISKEYLFDIPENRDLFFTTSERSLVVHYILRRANFMVPNASSTKESGLQGAEAIETELNLEEQKVVDEKHHDDDALEMEINTGATTGDQKMIDEQRIDFGIASLISQGVFEAAYPLHEPIPTDQELTTSEWKRRAERNMRLLLHRHWAHLRNLLKRQPLDYIRLYFGETVAFYFAWLGYYTFWLIPVAVFGLLVFIAGVRSAFRDPIVGAICNQATNITMCPRCDVPGCNYWRLSEGGCWRARFSRAIDNEWILAFSISMSIWACLFLEMWKRQQFRLAYKWNVQDLQAEEEPPRPEFLALIDKHYPKKTNLISGREEPYVSFWRRRFPILVFSWTTVLLSVCLALAFIVGVILYKLVISVLMRRHAGTYINAPKASVITTVTGSILSLIIIQVLNLIYSRVAVFLTNLEHHRTQSQYNDSVTFKLFLLQFFNYYASVFYIAFIQDTTAALPGEDRNLVQSFGCGSGGCLVDLCTQLVIIMVGKQILSAVQEYTIPFIKRLYNQYRLTDRKETTTATMAAAMSTRSSRCQADLCLVDRGPRPLFDEYIEMMIQFGFITIFVPAFPLAPFFALLNNVFEIRGDALKFVTSFRRPVSERCQDIGIWFQILTGLSRIAVQSNACILAFTTELIQRWVYYLSVIPPDGAMNATTSQPSIDSGYVNFTLSAMSTSRFNGTSAATGPFSSGLELCHYRAFRNPPWSDDPYAFSTAFWKILAAKFIFVYLFQNLVFLVTSLISWIVPDIPPRLLAYIKREAVQTNQILLSAELRRHEGCCNDSAEEEKVVPKMMAAMLAVKNLSARIRETSVPQKSGEEPDVDQSAGGVHVSFAPTDQPDALKETDQQA